MSNASASEVTLLSVYQTPPVIEATSAAKSSVFFSTPSPRARRVKAVIFTGVPRVLAVSSTNCSTV